MTSKLHRLVVRTAFAEKEWPATVSALVHEVKTPGKVNAWNQFVHHASAQDADYVFLMDADIVDLSLPVVLPAAHHIFADINEDHRVILDHVRL